MSQFSSSTQYNIDRPTGQCAFTGRELTVGEPYIATLVEFDPADNVADAPTAEAPTEGASNGAAPPPPPPAKPPKPPKPNSAESLGLKRVDVSLEAWQQGQRPPSLFSHWKSTVPEPDTGKKKLFVDDTVLLALFRRLADTEEQKRIAFRFVLALILMRKRLLKYEGNRKEKDEAGESREVWLVKAKGEEELTEVIDPALQDEEIQEVSDQLGEILEMDL